jgi:hypothetical protein
VRVAARAIPTRARRGSPRALAASNRSAIRYNSSDARAPNTAEASATLKAIVPRGSSVNGLASIT